MSLSTRVALALALACFAGEACAQTVTIQSGNRDMPARPFGLRVQTQMQVSLASPNLQNLEEQKTQQEVARRALYDMASRECRNLKETFGGECRLTSLSVNTNVQDRRPSGSELIHASASATNELSSETSSRP